MRILRLYIIAAMIAAPLIATGGPETAIPVPQGAGGPPILDPNSNTGIPSDPAAYNAYMTSKYTIPLELKHPDSWATDLGKYEQYVPGCEEDYEKTTAAAQGDERPPRLKIDEIVRTATLAGVPSVPLNRALNYIETNPFTVKNRDYACVLDYTSNKDEPRIWTVNLGTGESIAYPAGHGRGAKGDSSDPDGDGVVNEFSNTPDSYKSSTGCILTGLEQKQSAKVGPYYELHGLNETNSNNCPRRILGHGQVNQFRKKKGKLIVTKRPFDGTSAGCISTKDETMRALFSKCGGGGIICTNP